MKHRLFLTITLIAYSIVQLNGQKLNTDSLKTVLDNVWETDQGNRFKLIDLLQSGKTESEEYKKLLISIKNADTINLMIVTTLIDKYGWLGSEDVGFNGNQALFTVIQHADLVTQEKYFPIIQKAAKQGKTPPGNLAILEDRIALRKGGKQIYGSQIWIDSKTGKKYIQPIEDPENVDKKRLEVGLPTMNEYLQQFFQMNWNIEEYRKNLPIVEELLKAKKTIITCSQE